MGFNLDKQKVSYNPNSISSVVENSNNDYRMLFYYWIAFFSDKTAIPQFDPETGVEKSFKTVQEKENLLVGMAWIPFTHDLAKLVSLHTDVHVNVLLKPCSVVLNEGQRIIIFRRNQKKLKTSKSDDGVVQYPGQTVYVLGWQETRLIGNIKSGHRRKPRNYKYLMYLYEDGSVKLVSDDKIGGERVASYGGVFGGLY